MEERHILRDEAGWFAPGRAGRLGEHPGATVNESRSTKTFLIFSGGIGLLIGATALLAPDTLHGSSGIVLGADVPLRNEIRAAGGAILSGSVLILLGAFVRRLAWPALLFSALFYTSYGLGRGVSLVLDGPPGTPLLAIMALELAVGIVGVALSLRAVPAARPWVDRAAERP